MGDIAVSIDNVSKRFRLYHETSKSLKERVIRAGRNSYEEFYALRDVSFDVERGETFGLFGHNGSGKSTLLKCVAGTLRPTTGHISSSGRLAALLELGAGMHPDLTGRENIYMNGSIFGMGKVEVDKVFDEIIAFAELEQFVDLQLKHYSSGMAARLGFAVAVHVDPEILLVDEVLSVGDEAFQRKCLERIKQFQRDGRTIFVVTHAADTIRQIGNRAAVLDQGHLVFVGDPAGAVAALRDSLLRRGIDPGGGGGGENVTLGGIRLVATQVEAVGGGAHLEAGDSLRVTVDFEAEEPHDDLVIAINLLDDKGSLLIGAGSELITGEFLSVPAGPGRYVFELGPLALNAGVYEVGLNLHNREGLSFDHLRANRKIQVVSTSRLVGSLAAPVRGQLVEVDDTAASSAAATASSVASQE